MSLYRILFALCVSAAASAGQAAILFQPDSATASSEFSGSYDIGNAIDGSGLPAGFGPDDEHANYTQNNHWTTAANQVPGASATFDFDSPVTVGTFYLWNHRSNGVASNPNYEVTDFDLVLRDGGGGVLLSLPGLEADGETPAAQAFSFVPVDDVRSVEFTINDNQGLGVNSPNYTGVAEVAFAAEGVPEPAGLLLVAAACATAGAARRSH